MSRNGCCCSLSRFKGGSHLTSYFSSLLADSAFKVAILIWRTHPNRKCYYSILLTPLKMHNQLCMQSINSTIIAFKIKLFRLFFLIRRSNELIIIMKFSVDIDNNYCHYVIQQKAGSQLRYIIIRQIMM
jgi:hypothetical protein